MIPLSLMRLPLHMSHIPNEQEYWLTSSEGATTLDIKVSKDMYMFDCITQD